MLDVRMATAAIWVVVNAAQPAFDRFGPTLVVDAHLPTRLKGVLAMEEI
jgi:hypothetical protein